MVTGGISWVHGMRRERAGGGVRGRSAALGHSPRPRSRALLSPASGLGARALETISSFASLTQNGPLASTAHLGVRDARECSVHSVMAQNYALLPGAGIMYPQTDALKEMKDLSKNLVSDDFENEFRGRVMEKGGRKSRGVLWLSWAVGALAVWLVVLTAAREVQLARLRAELDDLTVNLLAVTANVKSLNQKLANNRLFNEFKTLEDTIYADDDQDGNVQLESVKESQWDKDKAEMERLRGLTVLEDGDELTDDEDMYDDDDAESGDWYQDYDRRRDKIGTTNMVHLTPEDFTGTAVDMSDGSLPASIREIKRRLNDNPEDPDIALPTVAPEADTSKSRDKRSVFSDPVEEAVDHFAAPRFAAKPDDRRKSKKFESASAKATLQSVSRIARSNDEDTRRPFIAAHFHGNTSHLSTEIHEHYKGNGLVRVPHDAAHDVWYPSPWTIASPHPRPTLTKNGHIKVHHTGVYLVYAQIYYLDSHDVISWVLHRTNPDMDGRDTLLQCAQSAHSSEPQDKPNSCYSAAALLLRAGDRLAVRNTGGDRHSLMQPEKSFIGLVKLADANVPDDEY